MAVGAAALLATAGERPGAAAGGTAVQAVQAAPQDARGWLHLAVLRLAEAGPDARADALILQSYRAGPRDARAGFERLALVLRMWPAWGAEVRAAALRELEALARWPTARGVTRGFLHDPAIWPYVCALAGAEGEAVRAISRALSEGRAAVPPCAPA